MAANWQFRAWTRLTDAIEESTRFVAETKFQHGSRSINSLLDLIPSKEEHISALLVNDLKLPLDSEEALVRSNLRYHIAADSWPSSVRQKWQQLSSTNVLVKCARPGGFLDRLTKFLLKEPFFQRS